MGLEWVRVGVGEEGARGGLSLRRAERERAVEHERARQAVLLGVVVHLGSMLGGHYVAYVRRDVDAKKKKKKNDEDEGGDDSPSTTTTTQCYRASDSHVAAVGEAEVLACEAYILLYGRVEEEVERG